MGPNEQNQHFGELGQKVCLHTKIVVLQRGLPSLDGKLERFVPKKREKRLPNSSQTDYSKLRKMPFVTNALLTVPPGVMRMCYRPDGEWAGTQAEGPIY